jgi:hypothetical protein
MKRLLTIAIMLSSATIITKTIMPTDSFKENKETLYKIRIRMAHFLIMIENQNMEAPSVLNQISSSAQELINAMVKIENNEMEGVMYSLNHIITNILKFKNAEKSAKMPPEANDDLRAGISNLETITKNILSLIPKSLRL